MMGKDEDNGGHPRRAIPLVAGAIVVSQITMTVATYVGDKLTLRGVGRKPLFLAGLASLPIRCALIMLLKDSGNAALMSTQILDGLGGGLFGLLHPYLVADITFGTGRFNVLSEYLFSWCTRICVVCTSTDNPPFSCSFISGCYRFGLWSRSNAFQLFGSNGR
jgi:MFS family permease